MIKKTQLLKKLDNWLFFWNWIIYIDILQTIKILKLSNKSFVVN